MFDPAAPVPQWSYHETAPTPQTIYPERFSDHSSGSGYEHQHSHLPMPEPPQFASNYSTPNLGPGYLRPPLPLTPINTHSHHQRTNTNSSTTTTQSSSSPVTPAPYYVPNNGYPTPSYSPAALLPVHHHTESPTLAPEYSMSSAGKIDPLVGLGIALPSQAPMRLEAPIDMNLGLQMDQLYTSASY